MFDNRYRQFIGVIMELQPPKKIIRQKKNYGLDKTNRSASLLRYSLIFNTKDYKKQFITEESKQIVHQAIYDYFYPKNQKREKIKLISVYVNTDHVKIDFQSLPTLNLKHFVNNLYCHSQNYLQKKLNHPHQNFWDDRAFLSTQRQVVKQQIDTYQKKY